VDRSHGILAPAPRSQFGDMQVEIGCSYRFHEDQAQNASISTLGRHTCVWDLELELRGDNYPSVPSAASASTNLMYAQGAWQRDPSQASEC